MLRKLGNVALEVAPSLTVQGYVFDFKAPLVAKRKIAPILIFALNANRKVTANRNVGETLTQNIVFSPITKDTSVWCRRARLFA